MKGTLEWSEVVSRISNARLLQSFRAMMTNALQFCPGDSQQQLVSISQAMKMDVRGRQAHLYLKNKEENY